MYTQPFITVVDLPEIGRLMEVSTIFYICRYCIFTWDGRFVLQVSLYIAHVHMHYSITVMLVPYLSRKPVFASPVFACLHTIIS